MKILEGWLQFINKKEFIAYVSENSGIAKKRINESLDAICDSICKAISNGEEIELTGFGKFSVKERAARVGRNLRTNEQVNIPARNVPVFNPGRWMWDALGGGEK